MPWTLNGCGATAEFVELLNFGPGPINIGCYILTDGDFSVTIPPNTILQPGEFYLIAGQDIIAAPCANIDSTVHADLNWNSCGCTSAPIPTTGDGFFTDGGSANEQVVLLDPNKNIVDAVIRDLPAETSSPITTSSIAGCSVQTFDLDTMNINYELLGMSTGRGNSFARKLDGDCGWVKDPQQSGNATNNTPGETSDVTYSFTIVQSMDCDNTHGSIDVYVNVGSATNVFPMNYTIAFDSNNDGIFNFSDTYTQGVDNTPPSIAIEGLPLGRYRVTVSSSLGCFLQTFEFSILACTPLLPTQLVYFNLSETKNNRHRFEWLIAGIENINDVALEKSLDGITFIQETFLPTKDLSGAKHFTQFVPATNNYSYYRLRLVNKSGEVSYSKIITTGKSADRNVSIYPNPAKEKLTATFTSTVATTAGFKVYNLSGSVVAEGNHQTNTGINTLQLPVQHLPPGLYQFTMQIKGETEPISSRFVKH